ncbi:MAG TPA: TadE/TadG family type IV pilus assembly protein [Rhizomicrobium sp.]|jgi:Flp pilus assembly protein TadG
MLTRNTIRRFLRNHRGLAAVEFALILPIMLMLFLGTVELSLALTARADVTNLTSATADLVAQETGVNVADLQSVFAAASAILYPYASNAAQITLTSVVYNTTNANPNIGTVAWSKPNGTNALTHNKGANFTVPAGIFVAPTAANPNPPATQSVIVSEVTYTYSSPVTEFLPVSTVWQNTFYSKPRRVPMIACSDCN